MNATVDVVLVVVVVVMSLHFFCSEFFAIVKKINSKNPTFETTTTKISEIEKSFLNKWGISFENRNDGKVSEKVLNYIQKGEKLNAMKAYKDENNVSLNVARNYIDKISKDHKYKL